MTTFEDEIRKNGYVVFVNKGDSMMPLLRENRDLIVIRGIKDPPAKNDVVLFKRENGAYVLHRIVKTYRDGDYLIVGDNRAFAEKIPHDAVIGVMTEFVRDGIKTDTNDGDYLAYVRSLKKRRRRLKARAYPGKIIKTIKRVLRRKKK